MSYIYRYTYIPDIVNRYANHTLPFSDEPSDALTAGTAVTNGTYAWFKVEPIVWYVSNWATLPASFTGEKKIFLLLNWYSYC